MMMWMTRFLEMMMTFLEMMMTYLDQIMTPIFLRIMMMVYLVLAQRLVLLDNVEKETTPGWQIHWTSPLLTMPGLVSGLTCVLFLRRSLLVIVRCGEWDTQSEDEPEPYQEVEVDRIQIHPNFNVDNHHSNFAILFLKTPFSLSSHISPVSHPKPGERLSQQNCVSHGWGKDKFGAEGRSDREGEIETVFVEYFTFLDTQLF